MRLDPNTEAFKLVPHKAGYHVHQVAANGSTLQLLNDDGRPVVVRSVRHLRDRLDWLVAKGKLPRAVYNKPIGF